MNKSAYTREALDKTPVLLNDKAAETMINIWNPYQAERNFLFSRNISFYATGTLRGCRYDITITKNGRAFIPHVEGRSHYEITI